MIGVVAYFCPFVFSQKPPPPAAVIDFLCKARIQNFQINSISVRRAVERDCQTRACSDLTITPFIIPFFLRFTCITGNGSSQGVI